MMGEELLAAAAAEVSQAMIDGILPSEHTFSTEFEEEMAVLIRKTKHSGKWAILRYVAAIVIAAITVFGSMYLLSPSVRAAVNGWVRSTFGSHFQYHTEDTTAPDVEYDYFLPEEFDGYTLLTTIERDAGKCFIYNNINGQMLSFEYYRGTENVSMFLIDIEDHTHYSTFIDSLPADVYIAPNDDEANIIVWHNPEDNALFCIFAFADSDQLITIAQKIDKIQIN